MIKGGAGEPSCGAISSLRDWECCDADSGKYLAVELRKGDHSAERLRIERERLELEREQGEKRMGEKLEALLQDPATKDRLCGTSTLTMEEKQRRLREIFGFPPDGCGTPPTGARPDGERA